MKAYTRRCDCQADGGGGEAAAGVGPAQPSLLLEVSAAEGASSRPNMTPLAHCYSPTLRKLAVVNSDSKLLVFGADKAMLLQNLS